MRILYFYQYFSTPKGSWGTRVYEFCKEWVEQGHEVTVVTSIYSKSDLKATKLIEEQVFDGIKVKILNIYIDNKHSIIKRIWSFVKFCVLSSWYALRLKADVVIASSGPLTVGVPGLVAKLIARRKLVFEVRDLWPGGAIELGIIKKPILIKLFRWFEKVCYRNSDYIIGLSPGMVGDIYKRYGYKNMESITNSANLALFGTKQNTPLPEYFQTKKVAIYTGNIGMANNSYLLYRAAVLLKKLNRNDIAIVLVGDGKQREELVEKAKAEGLDNFIVVGLMPKVELVNYIQNSIVSLVTFTDTPVLSTVSPNKLYESLAASVPVIQNTTGWLVGLLEENNCGFSVHPDNEQDLVDKLIYLADNPDEAKRMGEIGRQLAVREFDKKVLANKMLQVLQKVHDK
jgi:glycosyltransferase involved in cell wall biosynthesis